MTARAFRGVLVKPLADQHDHDYYIDPAGVDLLSGQVFITNNFEGKAVGTGTVIRRDGALVVEGVLTDEGAKLALRGANKLAIGVVVDKRVRQQQDLGGVVRKCRIVQAALTKDHADPDQPAIEFDEGA